MAGKMSHDEEKELHSAVTDLSAAASNVAAKLQTQSAIFEVIDSESTRNSQQLNANCAVFDQAIERMEKDKRNSIIVALIVAIVCLIIYLRI